MESNATIIQGRCGAIVDQETKRTKEEIINSMKKRKYFSFKVIILSTAVISFDKLPICNNIFHIFSHLINTNIIQVKTPRVTNNV